MVGSTPQRRVLRSAPRAFPRWIAQSVPVRILAGVAALLCVMAAPSSGRAGDFIKIGSPVATPVNLYAVTAVYDASPTVYEAWAVGEELNENGSTPAETERRGIILHFTGSFWTRVSFDYNIPPLRGISAVRVLRTQYPNGTARKPAWASEALAVGDKGTMVFLDPYSEAWRLLKKHEPATPDFPSETSKRRSCTEFEMKTQGDTCIDWTSKDLLAVAIVGPSNSRPMMIGKQGGVFQINSEFFDLGNGQGRGLYLGIENDGPESTAERWVPGNSTSVDLTALYFVDANHGWLVGKDNDTGHGKAWRYLKQFIEIAPPAGGFEPLTSVAGTLRYTASTPPPEVPEPLKGIAWFGAESGKIYRYDEGNDSIIARVSGSSPIRSLTVTRRIGGRTANLAKNSTFNADLLQGGPNYRPDGWVPSGEYWSAAGTRENPRIMLPSALVSDPGDTTPTYPPNPGNKVYVAEPWQSLWPWALPDLDGTVYSALGWFGSSTEPSHYPVFNLYGGYGAAMKIRIDRESPTNNDVSQALLPGLSLIAAYQSFWHYMYPGGGAPFLGADIPGYIRIDQKCSGGSENGKICSNFNGGNVVTTKSCVDGEGACINPQYQFRVIAPNGRVELFIDNDDNTQNRCSNNTAKSCIADVDCAGYLCVDPNNSRLPLSIGYTTTANALSAWQVGSCKNLVRKTCNRGDNAGQLCEDNVFCQQGYKVCSNTGERCYTNADCEDPDNPENPGICRQPTAPDLPQCVADTPKGCFDDANCKVGSCRGNTGTFCYTNNDCNTQTTDDVCDLWGICASGKVGKPCHASLDCGVNGVCELSGNGFCENASPTGIAEPRNAVTFGGKGILGKQCVKNDYTKEIGAYCFDNSQCGDGWSCQIVRSGWFPFALRYYQLNAARCNATNPAYALPCIDDTICTVSNRRSGGKCSAGKWCIGGATCSSGTQNGLPCTDIVGGTGCAGGTCVPSGNNGSICNSDSDCTAGTGARCVLQYKPALPDQDSNPTQRPGWCSNDTAIPCWVSNECSKPGGTSGTCVFPEKYTDSQGAKLIFQWKVDGGSWEGIPADHLVFNQKASGNATIIQDIPLTNIPGTTYQVTGRYKVEFLDNFKAYQSSDSRNPFVTEQQAYKPHAGVRIQCSVSRWNYNDCGYDINTLTTDYASGVTGNKRCSKDARILCRDSSECAAQNAGSCTTTVAGACSGNPTIYCSNNDVCTAKNAGRCIGDWIPFNVTISKQNRDPEGIRLLQESVHSLQVVCQADVGTRVFCDDITVTQVSSAASEGFDTVDVLAVGDSGAMHRSTFDIRDADPNSMYDNWQQQTSPIASADLNSAFATDPFHYWIAGNYSGIQTEKASLMTMNPGNVSGWAWVGAATKSGTDIANDPMGWIDFNCGNLGTCLSQPSSFGVNISDPTEEGVCSNDVSRSCSATNPCSASNKCLGFITGSAWVGNQDPNELFNLGPCSVSTTDTCRYGQCTNASSRVCAQNGQCMGTCALNQGFKCWRDADCKVSCATNPVACRSSGWLSFDRAITGDPPVGPYSGPYNSGLQLDTPLATFDKDTDQLSGWGRFQFGICSHDEKLSCFKDSECGTGHTCTYKSAGSWTTCMATYNDVTICNSRMGWIKLTGNTDNMPIPHDYDYLMCMDCTYAESTSMPNDNESKAKSTCKICTRYDKALGTPMPTDNSCNNCTKCTLKRCTGDANWYCNVDAECISNNIGLCKPFGWNATMQQYCFDMNTNTQCVPGARCTTCTTCSEYGVSVDFGDTKLFNGYAYSPDVGWIKFNKVMIGGKQYVQTQLGDIYSGKDIGSTKTSRPPGFPGGSGSSTNLCNATYRIIAAGKIENFCTSAPNTGSGTDPFQLQDAPLFPLPSIENRYVTQIGTIDMDGIASVAKTTEKDGVTYKYNKFGDRIIEGATDDVNFSSFFGGPGCGSGEACPVPLKGQVFYIEGNLTIDEPLFSITSGVPTPAYGVNAFQSGAGTFVVGGDLIINGNIEYEMENTLQQRVQLPSIAFLVKGDITINATSSSLKGMFYTPNTVDVLSSEPDLQLTVGGAMVAKKFNFNRKYRGPLSIEPSERIIYDGRLQANPPPGISTFASGLMNIAEFAQ
ncbi:MAG: hypothetical protein V1907_02000 [Candidatus Kerfeldbacteria bacterium]